MKIIGIGIDIICIKRIKKNIKKYGKYKLAKKILQTNELKIYKKTKKKHYFLAKKLSAKESLIKAFQENIQKKLYFSQIEIYNKKSGKPTIKLHKKAKKIYKKNKISKIHISISDEKKYAVSIIILEKNK